MGVFCAVLGSSLLRRSLIISTFAEQSPILNENIRPWGSMAPSLGLNFAESSKSITPRDRRNGMPRGSTQKYELEQAHNTRSTHFSRVRVA